MKALALFALWSVGLGIIALAIRYAIRREYLRFEGFVASKLAEEFGGDGSDPDGPDVRTVALFNLVHGQRG